MHEFTNLFVSIRDIEYVIAIGNSLDVNRLQDQVRRVRALGGLRSREVRETGGDESGSPDRPGDKAENTAGINTRDIGGRRKGDDGRDCSARATHRLGD